MPNTHTNITDKLWNNKTNQSINNGTEGYQQGGGGGGGLK